MRDNLRAAQPLRGMGGGACLVLGAISATLAAVMVGVLARPWRILQQPGHTLRQKPAAPPTAMAGATDKRSAICLS